MTAAAVREVRVSASVPAPVERAQALIRSVPRYADWLALHVAFRGDPPGQLSTGDEFGEQVLIMGIPADLAWTAAEVSDGLVVLDGKGPMDLFLTMRLRVSADGEQSRLDIEADISGDPVAGPLGATVAQAVEEALAESAAGFARFAGDAGELDLGKAAVRYERTGVRLDPSTPIIVGVGQVTQREPNPAHDPATLMAAALREAGTDSGAGDQVLKAADAIHVIASASWTYRDPGALVAEALGATPSATVVSAPYGGDAGQVLINQAGEAIRTGEAEVVLVCGAEAGSTLAAAQKQGTPPAWPRQSDDVVPTAVVGSTREANNPPESAAGLTMPIYTYALMESALRGKLGTSPAAHKERITRLWSGFSEVAAQNPHAWLPRAFTPEELATADTDNRMIAEPYSKLLCANLQVDLSAGIVLTSVAKATELGIPQEKWIFLHAGASAYDEWFVSERADLAASPAIRTIGEAAFAHTGLTPEQIKHVDLYSCFPVAVQIGAAELGFDVEGEKPLTVTGGLTFAGGPGNNYGPHAVATLVQKLRQDPESYGLSTSLGWFVTKHALGIYSATPPTVPYRSLTPVLPPSPSRPALGEYTGPGVIEAATAQYDRAGGVECAIVSVLTPRGERVLVRSTQPEIADLVRDGDPLWLPVEVASVTELAVTATTRVEALPEPPPMPVLVEKRGPLTIITINRPERRNAIDLAAARLLEQAIDYFEADPEAQIAILTGAGGTFSAGMDLKAAAAGQFALTEKRGPLGIAALPIAKPVIAAVEGHALAGGCELALVADLIVASTEAQFGIPEPKRGLVAAAGGVLRLTERLPRNIAMELALTGNPMSATRMAELGLVNRLAAPGEVLAAAIALAEEIGANAPLSIQASRQIVVESPGWSAAEAFDKQAEIAMVAIGSEDASEGVAAFAEHRAPVWRGR